MYMVVENMYMVVENMYMVVENMYMVDQHTAGLDDPGVVGRAWREAGPPNISTLQWIRTISLLIENSLSSSNWHRSSI